MQLFTYETMSENIDLTDTEGLWGVFTVKRRTSTQQFWLTTTFLCQIFTRRTCLYATCYVISYV